MKSKNLVMVIALTVSLAGGIGIVHGAWITEIVDNEGYEFGDARFTCLKFDLNGYPHIGYQMRGHPKYAYRNAAGWHLEVPEDDPETGWWLSMVLDQENYPHLSYVEYVTYQARYTWKDTMGWHFDIVDDSNPGDTAIALDSASQVHVAYMGPSGNVLNYAVHGQSGWERYTIDSNGLLGTSISLKLNSNTYPYISYYEWAEGDLRFARCNSWGWQFFTIDSAGDVGFYNSLAIDSHDFAHISYYDLDNHALKYAWRDSEDLHIEQLDSSVSSASGTSLVIDSHDQPHIAYSQDSLFNLRYAWFDGNAWHFETIESTLVLGYISLDLDDDDMAAISYQGDGFDLYLTYQSAQATPTPPPAGVSYDLVMPDVSVSPGDDFLLSRTSNNSTANSVTVDEYIILDVQGSYWYWPEWGTDPDWRPWTLDAGRTYTEDILHCIWPQGAGAFSGIVFWGGMVEAGTANLVNYDMISWDYSE